MIHWPAFLISALLLLPPIPIPVRLGSTRLKLLIERGHIPPLSSLFLCWQNWLDLVRAGIGTYLVTQFAITPDPAVAGSGMKALMIQSAILGVGVLFQTVRFAKGTPLVGPLFYLSGLTVMLAGYYEGGFAVLTGWLFAFTGKDARYQLPAMGVAVAIGSFVLNFSLAIIVNCALIFIPLLLSIVFRKDLVFCADYNRRRQTTPVGGGVRRSESESERRD